MNNVNMMTLYCQNKDCMGRLRIGRFLDRPTIQIGAFKFCPICGSTAFAMTDTDENYWEALATAHNLPIDIIQKLFAMWQDDLRANETKHTKLVDYIEALRKETANV